MVLMPGVAFTQVSTDPPTGSIAIVVAELGGELHRGNHWHGGDESEHHRVVDVVVLERDPHFGADRRRDRGCRSKRDDGERPRRHVSPEDVVNRDLQSPPLLRVDVVDNDTAMNRHGARLPRGRRIAGCATSPWRPGSMRERGNWGGSPGSNRVRNLRRAQRVPNSEDPDSRRYFPVRPIR